MIKIKRGLTLPLSGEPEQSVHAAASVRRIGLLPSDYAGLDLQLCVKSGERVRTGQAVLCDRACAEVKIVAPATGQVEVIAGDEGELVALAIAVEADEFVDFAALSVADLAAAPRETIVEILLAAGLWPALRTRPLQKIPDPQASAHAIFVTAMDTQPLAVRPDRLIETEQESFSAGLTAISRLSAGLVYVCKAPAAYVPVPDIENIKVEEFAGPHPAGLAGTHIHFLDPVGVDLQKQVWSIGYQDVIAIGSLLLHGRFAPERVIALAGPQVVDPRLLRVRQGAAIGDLVAGELREGDSVIIAGSVFAGQQREFLGADQLQITALAPPSVARDLFGVHRFSLLPVFIGNLLRGRRFRLAAEQPAPVYPLLPTAALERIWALRLPQRPLLRALLDGDIDAAIALGALELAEEDLALATFASAGRQEFGPLLRAVLERCEERGQ